MSTEIIVAIITGIAGPVITFVATKEYEKRFLEVLSQGRRRNLTGLWGGQAHQEVGPDGHPLDFKLNVDLKTTRKTVKGTAHFSAHINGQDRDADFGVSGGFLHERFLTLKYKNKDDDALQFGNMTLEMSGDGRALHGRYLGYGAISERLVYGTIELERR